MRCILFLGGQVGHAALIVISKMVTVSYAFIETEHENERVRYSDEMEALCHDMGILATRNLSHETVRKICQEVQADAIMCFGYRRLIKEDICNTVNIGCFGSHFAPLPRYRGFCPLNWVLINGETETAVNIFWLSDSVDAGNIIASKVVPISGTDDINALMGKCISVLPEVIKEALSKISSDDSIGTPQDDLAATYTCSRNPEDGLIDWNSNSKAIYNLVRALTYPYPGAFTMISKKKLFVWECEVVDELPYVGRIPGKVIGIERGTGVRVLTADGSLLLKKCSLEDGPILRADELIKSVRVTLGG